MKGKRNKGLHRFHEDVYASQKIARDYGISESNVKQAIREIMDKEGITEKKAYECLALYRAWEDNVTNDRTSRH